MHLTKTESCKIYKNEELSMSDIGNTDRYIIIKKSISAHCCFGYTIIDTKGGKWMTKQCYWNRSMCEAFEKEEAIEICTALNKCC